MLGGISISKQGMSSSPKDTMVNIEIEDSASGLNIIRVSLTPEMYGMIISGCSCVECDITQLIKEEDISNVGKELDVKILVIPEFKQAYAYSKKTPTALKILVEAKLEKGWSVSNYGMHTKQTNPKGHEVIIRRYI